MLANPGDLETWVKALLAVLPTLPVGTAIESCAPAVGPSADWYIAAGMVVGRNLVAVRRLHGYN